MVIFEIKTEKLKTYKYKIILLGLIITFIIIALLSYNGLLFFTSGFNDLDFLVFNILGDALLVGIVTHISSKNISLFISYSYINSGSSIISFGNIFFNFLSSTKIFCSPASFSVFLSNHVIYLSYF